MADVEETQEVPAEEVPTEPTPEAVVEPEVAPAPEETPAPIKKLAKAPEPEPEPEPEVVPVQEVNIAALEPFVRRAVFYVPEAGVLAHVLLLELQGDGSATLLWNVTAGITNLRREFAGVPYDAAGAVGTWREVA